MKTPPKILIVDDKIENIIALERLLAKQNVNIIRANSGNQGLTMTLQHDFALALIDVQMPEMDGFEMVQIMRQDIKTQYLPVIFISAIYQDDYHKTKGIKIGAVDFITKPIVPEILLYKVHIFIEIYEQKKKLEQEIAERIKVENALKKAKEEAESANRIKGEFLAIFSHEIRNPMNAVMGFNDLLSSEITDKKQKNYLNSIHTACNSILILINDILDFSKIEAGRLDIQYYNTNIINMFNELQKNFTINFTEKNLEFIVEVDKTLPHDLILDETRLRQVLVNLISNAIKFTEYGQIKLSALKKPVEQVDGEHQIDLIIIVEDSGIGIPDDQQDIIFEPFRQQEGQNTQKYGGTGLGLSITKHLVEMMNGYISVKSHIGKGSIFEITLREVNIAATVSAITQELLPDLNQITFEKSLKNFTSLDKTQFPKLFGTMEKKILPIWKNISGAIEIDVVDDFAQKIIKLGDEYHVSELIQYGEDLREFTQNVDIKNIKGTLKKFPEIMGNGEL
ncbi:MAG: response regulator [Thiomargarita sp.]|nr:response regulator [Thiomargarita sp.]